VVGKAVHVAEREERPLALARAEIVGKAIRGRLELEVDAALKRKSSSEGKLAGALRAVGPLSPQLRSTMADAAEVMVRRKSFNRELYAGCVRALAEVRDPRAARIITNALGAEDAGGTPALGAACMIKDNTLSPILSKVAASRQSHLAFAAETARVARGESNGSHLLGIAPMIKEAHRIALCLELFVPLTRSEPVPLAIAPALAVLRQAERHLGRWLVLGEIAVKAGDSQPLQEATERSTQGPQSSRAAWSLVAWALADTVSRTQGKALPPAPTTRPTVELVARLSDRPSADRDPSFLFRMAKEKATAARPMLEALAKNGSARGALSDANSIRAAMYLARDHGREDLRNAIATLAKAGRPDELRGLAAAAMWDLSMHDDALAVADELAVSKHVTNVAWAALVRAASQRTAPPISGARPKSEERMPLLTETSFRWVQSGWLE
jgi:hypothetical protein